MPAGRVSEPVQWALIASVFVTLGLVWAGVWSEWMYGVMIVVFVAGAWWISSRDKKVEAEARTDRQQRETTRETMKQQASEAEYQSEIAEHERVERVLMAIVKREGVRYEYRGPMGGHMDKREGTYTLAAPLPVTVADIAALNGPLTRFESTTAPDGRVSLTKLVAVDRHFGGVEVFTPRT